MMIAEDARSMALRNFSRIKADEVVIQELKFKNGNLTEKLKISEATVNERDIQIQR